MKYEQYRKELEQIRLTKESKAALIQALKAKQAPYASRSPRRWNRLTLIAAAMAAVLVISASRSGGIPCGTKLLWKQHRIPAERSGAGRIDHQKRLDHDADRLCGG